MSNKKEEKTGQPDSDTAQQFEALFNFATIGIVVTNPKGIIINFNKYAEKQFGFTKEEALGQAVEILIPTKFSSTHTHHRHNFYKEPTPRVMGEGRDLFGKKKDGTEFPVEISLSSYINNGETYVIAFIIDITVRKKNEAAVLQQKEALEKITGQIKHLNTQLEQKVEDRTKMLRETLAELERSKDELSEALDTEKELSELKSRFVTMASHEFRTPLSTILSSAFLLQKYNEEEADERREKHILRIKGAVGGMKGILEDFLSLGKLEEGSIQSTMETVTSTECFTEIGDIVHEMSLMTKPGQQIAFSHSGDAAVVIDKHLLKNILINLISNAVKFSPEHSVIKVNCIIAKDDLSIEVKDSGIGISADDQQHLFERFFRAKNAANIQGTGLGLHIINKYLELMNGSIEMESILNKGSTFRIHIPQ